VKRPLLALLASTALLAGCGTGLEATTYKETGREDGAIADVGGRTGIAVRYLHVEGPALGSTHALGATAALAGALVNNGSTADALVGVSSDLASSARLVLRGQPVTAVPVPALGSAGTAWRVELVGLVRTLHAGTFIPVTLSFAKAGRITLQVPVHAGDNALDVREVSQDPYSHGEGEAHEEPADEGAAPVESAPATEGAGH